MKGNIFKLKKDRIDEWGNWAKYLESQKKEVLMSLEEENISFEGSFIFEINNEKYVCLYAKEQKKYKYTKS